MKVYVYGSNNEYVSSDEQYLGTACYQTYEAALKALMHDLEEDASECESSPSEMLQTQKNGDMKLWFWNDGDHNMKYWIKECDVQA